VRLLGSSLRGFFTRFVIALAVVGVATGAAIVGVNFSIDQKLDKVERVKIDPAPPPPEGANFLLIGSDSRDEVDTELEEEAFGDPESAEAAGQRSDTMMVVHVEPDEKRSFVVSFPRDLLVEVPGYGREQINAAYSLGGEQLVIDTLWENFQIPIHHYVEIGLLAFVDIVNAIGSVPVYLPGLVKDDYTGFQLGVYGAGCYDVDGEQALQYVRARHMEQFDPETGEFVGIDTQSDINRIGRQQAFIRRLAALAVSKGLNNPLTANSLADGVLEHLKLDTEFSREDIFGLLNTFRDVDPNDPTSLEMTTIPWQPYEPDPNRLVVDEVAAEPVLARLRDFGGTEAPTDVVPADVRVRTLNGSGQEGAAEEASSDLQAEGFQTVGFSNAAATPATQILYAPGLETSAHLVQAYLGGIGTVVEDSSIVDADVVVVIGDDYIGVRSPSGGGTALGAVDLVSAVRPAQEVPIPDLSTPPPEAIAC
jgi:polyisoprenyl-teichoic acid--peptidoglycan teichoic acid transferase